jgi:hypothetical protein
MNKQASVKTTKRFGPLIFNLFPMNDDCSRRMREDDILATGYELACEAQHNDSSTIYYMADGYHKVQTYRIYGNL